MKQKSERSHGDHLRLLARHRSGESVKALSNDLGITNGVVRQILANAKRIEKELLSGNLLIALSTRTMNTLLHANLETVELVRRALQTGALDRESNIGAKRRREIEDWLKAVDQAGGKPQLLKVP